MLRYGTQLRVLQLLLSAKKTQNIKVLTAKVKGYSREVNTDLIRSCKYWKNQHLWIRSSFLLKIGLEIGQDYPAVSGAIWCEC
jgi:hypothetical protein